MAENYVTGYQVYCGKINNVYYYIVITADD